jgi:hypothetical protein
MTRNRVEFGDHTAGETTVRCVRCGHAVVVMRGACVPRCYCGGHEFDVAAADVATADDAPRDAARGARGPRPD